MVAQNPELNGPHMVTKVALESFAPDKALEYKQIGMTGLIIDPETALEKPTNSLAIELTTAGTITPKGETPPVTIILDPTRCEMQTTRINHLGDVQAQMKTFEDQEWAFSLPGTSTFIDHRNIGRDGKMAAIMVRPLSLQAK